MPRTAPWLVLLAGAVLACGGKSLGNGRDADDESGISGSSTGAASGSGGTGTGATAAGESFAGSPSGGNATGGSAGALQCDVSGLKNETSAGVEVRLINGTQHAIYLGSQMPGCDVPLVQVTSPTGPLPDASLCGTTCEQLLSGTIVGCLPILCPVGSVLKLAPGESSVISWSGLHSEEVSVPPACQSKSIGSQCQRIVRAKPGSYVFSAQAGSAMMCNSPDLVSCQSCEPSGDGGCRTSAATIVGPLLHAEAKVFLDASYGIGETYAGVTHQVEITFVD